MKILIFTEGTILMHASGANVSREERVRQVQENVNDEIHQYHNYIPIGDSVNKISNWVNQGALICYLTSRRSLKEIGDIKNILEKYEFPKGELYFRKDNEQYKDVAERVLPDILIEDDCESIGGEKEMTYPHIDAKIRSRIKSYPVKEFGGIDHLPEKQVDLI